MTKGNLYYYFRNKEEILFACHDYSLDVLLQLMEETRTEDTPPDAKLRKLAEDIIKAQEAEITMMKEWLAKNGE